MSDVFVSYSSKDKNIAHNLCAKLEQANIKCWMAPRDISPGEDWAAGIMRGINNCKCMVLVFSNNSNDSRHVLSEVESAFSSSKVIVPFKISDSMATNSMEYFLNMSHWLDASDDKLDSAIYKLIETVAGILQKPIDVPAPPPLSSPPASQALSQGSRFKKRLALAAAIVIVASIGSYAFLGQENALTNIDPCAASFDSLVQQNANLLNDASMANLESVNEISCQLPNRAINVKAWLEPNRSQFMEGDEVSFKVSLDTEAYLAVYVHSMDDSTYLIYPNPFAKAEVVPMDSVFSVGNGNDFVLEIAEPFGVDAVQFIATTDQKEFNKLLEKHEVLQGTNLHVANRGSLGVQMRGINARGINVKEAVKTVKTQNPDKLWGEALILLHTRKTQ